jgi:hypothetical protein
MVNTQEVENSTPTPDENKAVTAAPAKGKARQAPEPEQVERPLRASGAVPEGKRRVTLAAYWREYAPGDEVDLDVNVAAALDNGGYLVRS